MIKGYSILRNFFWIKNYKLVRQGANLAQEAPKHDHLIKWPTWSHMIVWKIYIATFTRFIANRLSRLLIFGRIFSTQTLKSSPISCLLLEHVALHAFLFVIITVTLWKILILTIRLHFQQHESRIFWIPPHKITIT